MFNYFALAVSIAVHFSHICQHIKRVCERFFRWLLLHLKGAAKGNGTQTFKTPSYSFRFHISNNMGLLSITQKKRKKICPMF